MNTLQLLLFSCLALNIGGSGQSPQLKMVEIKVERKEESQLDLIEAKLIEIEKKIEKLIKLTEDLR